MERGVRLLTREDAAACAVLHERCFTAGDNWTAFDFRDLLTQPSTLGVACEDAGLLAGFILFQTVPPDAEMLTLAVSPDFRRMGLATQLLHHASQLLGQYGTDRLLLDVAADNSGAIAFYRAHGFSEDGRRKAYYRRGGSAVDALLMSRPLAGQIPESRA